MTVIELLLSRLPEKYVDCIVNNVKNRSDLYTEAHGIIEELMCLFDWTQSREGYEFWDAVVDALDSGDELPEIPIDIHYAPGTIFLVDDTMIVMNSFDTGINVAYDVDYSKMHLVSDNNREKMLSILN